MAGSFDPEIKEAMAAPPKPRAPKPKMPVGAGPGIPPGVRGALPPQLQKGPPPGVMPGVVNSMPPTPAHIAAATSIAHAILGGRPPGAL